MKLTREQIEGYKKSDNLFGCNTVHKLCDMLLAEMDKPKVWDGAPEWASVADVSYIHYGDSRFSVKSYTRELPKSPEREIAEKYDGLTYINRQGVPCKVSDVIESAINEYKESVK